MAKDNDKDQLDDEVSAPDMDRITATIRRVQAQAAAYEAQAADQPEEGLSDEEDPIEATIRRVQAQAASQADDFAPVSSQMPAPEDDDPIEATIRRVQEQAARASLDVGGDALGGVDEDAIEATIRRVQAQSQQPNAVDPSAQESEQDLIDATIRRVQAQVAQTSSLVDPEDDEAEDPIEATIRRVQAQAAPSSELEDEAAVLTPSILKGPDLVEEAIRVAEAEPVVAGTLHNDQALPEATSWPGRDERLLGEASTWEIAALRLEQGLQDAQRDVRALTDRVAELERLVQATAVDDPPSPLSVVPPSAAAVDDDDWDDRPRMSAMQFGVPPPPPVYRDPSPQTATAAQLVEEYVPDVEKPVARLRAINAEGNLDDRIPRQYRITVEDKRRGVDLVPLHRAMQGMDNVKDMSLLSYSNGVAMVLVETVGPLDPEVLRLAVGRVMSRETLVEVHNEQTMVVKIQEE